MKERRQKDSEFKLKKNISSMMWHCLKQNNLTKQRKRTFKILEYTLQDLKQYLEQQFDENMTWDNYGSRWHIDHVIPQSYFKFDSIEHPNFKKCWSLRNLRPLESIENISKSNVIDENLIKKYNIEDLLQEEENDMGI